VQNLRFEGDWRDHLPADIRAEFPDGVIVGNIVGSISDAELTTLETGKRAILATLELIDQKTRDLFLHFQQIGRLDLLNFSINGSAGPHSMVERVLDSGKKLLEVLKIEQLFSLDIVTLPGAGGHVRGLLASASLQLSVQPQQRSIPMLINMVKRYLDTKGYTYQGAAPLQMLASLGVSDDV